MNNSDFNDFNNWQNGDEGENNPNNHPFNNFSPKSGFFYYGPMSDQFKHMWQKMYNKEDYMDELKNYLNIDDIIEKHAYHQPYNKKPNPKKMPRNNKNKPVMFTQEDYLKVIEIRGYLAINEQYAHVKALDKILNQIVLIPKDK
jgi:hypothetical protein